LTIDYGEYLTNDVARKMHGMTVNMGRKSADSADENGVERAEGRDEEINGEGASQDVS
jgi:hypothetical protein